MAHPQVAATEGATIVEARNSISEADHEKLPLPKKGTIRGETPRKQRFPFEFMPHLMSWVVGSACFTQVACVLAMIVLAFLEVGGYYPYLVLGIMVTSCFFLILTFFGRNGVVHVFGSKAETH